MDDNGISHQIIKEHQLIYVCLQGQNSMSELLTYLFALSDDADYQQGMPFIIDTRLARSSGRSTQEARLDIDQFMQQPAPETPERVRVAIVLTEDLEFGLTRMYTTYLDMPFLDTQLFKTIDDAIKWLGVPASAKDLISFPQ